MNSNERKSLLRKVLDQILDQNENIEDSIKQKEETIARFQAYPNELKKFVGNYILTERQQIVDRAEKKLRGHIRPIELKLQESSSARPRRALELKEAEKRKQAALERQQKLESKHNKAFEQLKSIFKSVDDKVAAFGQ